MRVGGTVRAFALAMMTTLAPVASNAQQFHGPQSELIEDAVVVDGRIFAISDGQLRTFPLDGGETSPVLATDVIAMHAGQGEFWIARQAGTATERTLPIEVLRWTRTTFEAVPRISVEGDFVTIASDQAGLILLSQGAIYRLQRETWRRKPVIGAIGWHARAVQVRVGASLYVGFDNGEWGGGLRRVDLGTGIVTDIEKYDDGNECNGPLYSGCSPVTALIADADNSSCVYASVGLTHFFERGAVVRVCGDEVESVFELPFSGSAFDDGKMEMTEAVYGLALAPSGYWAMTRRRLYLVRNGAANPRSFDLQSDGPLLMSRPAPNLIVLATNLRATVSLSGTTPLLVSIPPSD